jgi:hypothetical protein
MKRIVLFTFALSVIAIESFSQFSIAEPNFSPRIVEGNIDGNHSEKILGLWVIPYDGAYSSSARIPGNTWRYQRTQYLVTPAEIVASGFPAGVTIDAISYNILQAGIGTQSGNLKIYLKNTSDATYSLGSNWTTTGFTMVCDIASWTVPVGSGSYIIPFTGGNSFTYTGGGVYVAWEFSNPSGSLGTTALQAQCNTSLTNGLYGERSATAMPQALVASNFRPATRFINNSIVDVINIANIYTLEKVALSYGTPVPLAVRVTNQSTSPASFDVTMTIMDQTNTIIRYTTVKNVSNLTANGTTIINFTGWSPTIQEDVYIIASADVAAGETWTQNNSTTIRSSVNNQTLSYNYNNINPFSFGINYPASTLFLSKFKMNGTGSVNGTNLVLGNHNSNIGNSVYAVVLNSAGVIIDQSASYIIQALDLGAEKFFPFPTSPSFTNDSFYVGLAQTSGSSQWYPLGTFEEAPVRGNTFYTASLAGGTLTPLPANYTQKFGIEAVVGQPPTCIIPSALNATAITQTSANFSWSPGGSELSWEYYYGPAPLTVPTGSGISTNSSSLNAITSLNQGTTYQFYVRADCGSGDFSSWAGPYTFSTQCGTFLPPFTETFEIPAFPPTCWTSIAGSGSWNRSVAAGGYGGSTTSALANFFSISGSLQFDLISPDFTTAGMIVPQLNFQYAYATYSTEIDSLKIYYSTNGGQNYLLLLGMDGGPAGVLNTGGVVTAPFVPTPTQWATKTINLPAGTNKVKFSAKSAYGNNLYIDNIIIQEEPTCIAPTDLSSSNITPNSAKLGWTQQGTANSWDIELLDVTLSPTGIPTQTAMTNPYTYPGLTAATAYKYYVRANCGAGGMSLWSGPFLFTTSCDPSLLPLIEKFDAVAVGEIPVCWKQETNTSQWRVQTNLGSVSAPNSIVTYYHPTLPKNDWFFSPGFEFTAGISYDVKFLMKAPGWSGTGESLEVKWGSFQSASGMTGGTIYSDTDIQFQTFTQVKGSFEPTVTGIYYIGWHANSMADLDYIAIDNIIIEPTPTCPSPFSLNATNITSESAMLSWTQSGTEVSWEIELGVSGFAPTGIPTQQSMTNSYNFTGLAGNTMYDFYVRAFCGGTDYSVWSDPHSFKTLCEQYALPYTEDFENGTECWTINNIDGGGTNWQPVSVNHTPGGNSAVGHLFGIPGYQEHGRFISPEIILPAGFPVTFSFWSYNMDAAVYGQNYVVISSDHFNSSDTIWSPMSVNESLWEQVVLDISSYAGDTVIIAFIYKGIYAHGWVIDDISVFVPTKTLNLNVLLEGLVVDPLFGLMRPVQEQSGGLFFDKYGPDVADVITVSLHDTLSPFAEVFVRSDIHLPLDGSLTITDIPGNLNSAYYLVIKHRNSIETWSSIPIDYSTFTTIYYTFTSDLTQAYGNNLKPLTGGGYFAIYSGDVNQDGIIDGTDMSDLENDVNAFLVGYVVTNINGDGLVDATDITFLENNGNAFIVIQKP